MPSLLGIDSGLTVTKAVVFDAQTGSPLAIARRRVAQSIPAPGHIERDMDGLWQASAEAIAEALAACGRPASDILAVAATAHGDGLYLLDRDARPLGPAIVSLDTRAADLADRWNAGPVGPAALALTGQQPHASAPSALLAWIKTHQPERYSRIGHFLAAKDWLTYCLCGTVGTDRTEASTSFTRVESQAFDDEAFALFGLEDMASRRPDAAGSVEIVGRVTDEAARLSGLVAGTPVVAGLHDVTASALGVGGYGVGVAAVIAGTYSINETVSLSPKVDARWFCRNGILAGEWNAMSISPASTANYDWFIDQLCASDSAAAEASGDGIHARLAAEFDRARARPSSVLFHPYLFGSPFGGASSAGFYGLNAWHERADLVRAVLEGIAFNHRIHVEALVDGFKPGSVRLTGGISRNPAIAGLFADVLGLPVTATKTEEAAAWGAALCAGVGAGAYARPTDDPRDLSAIETVTQPDPARQALYEARYQLFCEIADTMRPLWPKLRALGHAQEGASR
ncbi:carbohydrate kinase [Xaviernesmea oryzae]|uniref:Carbohydrate kinase n=1 Tax=Xaviernesmea oryzae TaxID=464029 RepID=A0A1Q9B187_9HYPH|nr:FGGY-family carbohydrate kinase [Xaviernesmea oryzae]OLP61736.1 carbohydrate kinase [Xaviernesmea oryzae]SEL03096.1 L-xylulokinase [Xaviernesmea oryzae]